MHGKFGGASTASKELVSGAALSDSFFHDVRVDSIGVDRDFGHGNLPRSRRLCLGLLPALCVRRVRAGQSRHLALRHRPRRGQPHHIRAFYTAGALNATDAVHNHLVYGYTGGLGVDVNLVGGLFMRAEWEYIRFTSTVETSINTVRAGLGYKF